LGYPFRARHFSCPNDPPPNEQKAHVTTGDQDSVRALGRLISRLDPNLQKGRADQPGIIKIRMLRQSGLESGMVTPSLLGHKNLELAGGLACFNTWFRKVVANGLVAFDY